MNEGYTYSLTQTAAPALEPVTLAEAKAHCRIDIPDDDALVTAQITAARCYAEEVTRRQFITATYGLYFADFPPVIELPRPPGLTVTSVKYYDVAGTLTTLTVTTDYQTDFTSEPARIMPAYTKTWPTVRPDTFQAVQVVYTCGYGATAASVPQPIRQAIMAIVGTLYWHRETVIVGTTLTAVSQVADHLLWPYRCFGF